jgi:hypothetical protein
MNSAPRWYVHEVVIACASAIIARHERSYEREVVVFDPLHYLALLEQKTRALDQAAPLAGWQLPECFAQLRRLLEARLKKHGSREYVQVLRLMETFAPAEVTLAVEDALLLSILGNAHALGDSKDCEPTFSPRGSEVAAEFGQRPLDGGGQNI